MESIFDKAQRALAHCEEAIQPWLDAEKQDGVPWEAEDAAYLEEVVEDEIIPLLRRLLKASGLSESSSPSHPSPEHSSAQS